MVKENIVSFTGFIGKKLGMTQVFEEDGSAIPVTVVLLYDMKITQLKTEEKDGYSALQIGCVPAKAKHLTKAEQQHLLKHGNPLLKTLKEFRVASSVVSNFSVGDTVSTDFIEAGQKLSVTSTSIGKGTMGTIRRWGHHRGPMSHGSKNHRLPGSIGAGTTPGRVFKGLQMAGRKGNKAVMISNLKVVRFYPEKQVVLIKGSLPGSNGALVVAKLMKK